jgi:hypothetical protein
MMPVRQNSNSLAYQPMTAHNLTAVTKASCALFLLSLSSAADIAAQMVDFEHTKLTRGFSIGASVQCRSECNGQLLRRRS